MKGKKISSLIAKEDEFDDDEDISVEEKISFKLSPGELKEKNEFLKAIAEIDAKAVKDKNIRDIANSLVALGLDGSLRSSFIDSYINRDPEIYNIDTNGKLYQEAVSYKETVRALKNDFASSNLRFVVHIVASFGRKFSKKRLKFLDLIQEGNLGLMKAVDKFDYRRGTRFSTYAINWIKQGIRRGYSEKARTIRYPVHFVEFLGSFKEACKILEHKLSRSPTAKEITEYLESKKVKGTSKNRVETVMLMGDDEPFSFDLVPTAHPDYEAISADNLYSKKETVKEIMEYLSDLVPREQDVIIKHFNLDGNGDYTLDEIGKIYNISRERVRQVEGIVMSKLLRHINSKNK